MSLPNPPTFKLGLHRRSVTFDNSESYKWKGVRRETSYSPPLFDHLHRTPEDHFHSLVLERSGGFRPATGAVEIG